MLHNLRINICIHIQRFLRIIFYKICYNFRRRIMHQCICNTIYIKKNVQRSTLRTIEIEKKECLNICASKLTIFRKKINFCERRNIVDGVKNHLHILYSIHNQNVHQFSKKSILLIILRRNLYKWTWNFKNLNFLPPKNRKEEVKYGLQLAYLCLY